MVSINNWIELFVYALYLLHVRSQEKFKIKLNGYQHYVIIKRRMNAILKCHTGNTVLFIVTHRNLRRRNHRGLHRDENDYDHDVRYPNE